jgi:hypothetical protein
MTKTTSAEEKEGSDCDNTKQPKMKKPKTTVSALNMNFECAKKDIELSYEKQIKLLKGKKAEKIKELTEKHDSAIQEVIHYEVRKEAGTLEAAVACGTCGKEIPDDDEGHEKCLVAKNVAHIIATTTKLMLPNALHVTDVIATLAWSQLTRMKDV